jgi:hypothetical protein
MPHPLRARFRVTYEADFDLWGCSTREEYIAKVKANPAAMRTSIINQILAEQYERASVEPEAGDVEIKFLHIIDENSATDYHDLLPPEVPEVNQFKVYTEMED